MSGLRLDNAGSSHSLQASWQPSEGGVDLYLVTLTTPGSFHQEHRLLPNITQVVFEGLTAGLVYELIVRTAAAGGVSPERITTGRTGICQDHRLRSPQLLCCTFTLFLFLSFPVPERVSALTVLPIGDGKLLRLSWVPPRGHWDNYSILLKNGSEVLVNQTISKASVQHTFSVLALGVVPGRVYDVAVTVHSGLLDSTAHCYVQLGVLISFYVIYY